MAVWLNGVIKNIWGKKVNFGGEDFSKFSPQEIDAMYTKNELVKLLHQRNIDHNKRQVKIELINLLRNYKSNGGE